MEREELKELIREVIREELRIEANSVIENDLPETDAEKFSYDFRVRSNEILNKELDFNHLSDVISLIKEYESKFGCNQKIAFPDDTSSEGLKDFLTDLMLDLKNDVINVINNGIDKYEGDLAISADGKNSSVMFTVLSGHWDVKLTVFFDGDKYDYMKLDVTYILSEAIEF